MRVEPYLSFEGRGDEAIELYKNAVGAKVLMLMRFKDAPEQMSGTHGADVANKVMHARLKMGDSVVMLSDGRCTGKAAFTGIALSLTLKTEAEAERCFAALSEGGTVTMPLAKTFFSPKFGMVQDKFGVGWMVIVEH